MTDIRKKLIKIKGLITESEKKYDRIPSSVLLVAISKTQNIEKIKEAALQQQLHFGENYLQEALPKIKELANEKIIWHFVGKIQTNKTKLIAQNFSWVETVTNYKAAELLNNHRPKNMPKLNICIQVNISDEPSKAGIACTEIIPLAEKIMPLPHINLRGLMAIPKSFEKFEQQFEIFNKLSLEFKKLQKQNPAIDTLSMGMSNDFIAAIAAGSTMVRIGSAIFGLRAVKTINKKTVN